jgi:cyclopropane-fatty-acyl-phospholipid synthase
MFEKRICHALFSRIDTGGLEVTYWDGQSERYGPGPWLRLHLRSPGVIWAIARNVDLGAGEAYVNGDIEMEGDLAEFVRVGAANGQRLASLVPELVRRPLGQRLPKRHSKAREAANVRHHYDLGNDFYRLWLDRSMTYSCAYFRTPGDSLEQAQRQKVEHILRKLDLTPGMTLLDIGSGWGELIVAAAKQHGARAHGITLSTEQLHHTRERIAAEGLTDRVSVELLHYEDLPAGEGYDRIVSVGMYEHVGVANHAAYMAAVDRALRPGGVSLLHTITQTVERPIAPWTDRYIFPGGHLPTVESVLALLPPRDFHAVDYESLRRHYARTLQEWWERFERARGQVREMYDERFVRMWRLYLRGAFAAFSYGKLDLAQILWTKGLSDTVPMTREYMYPPRLAQGDANGDGAPAAGRRFIPIG